MPYCWDRWKINLSAACRHLCLCAKFLSCCEAVSGRLAQESPSRKYVFRNFGIKGSHSEIMFLSRNHQLTQVLQTIFRGSSMLTGTSDNCQLLQHNINYISILGYVGSSEPCFIKQINNITYKLVMPVCTYFKRLIKCGNFNLYLRIMINLNVLILTDLYCVS